MTGEKQALTQNISQLMTEGRTADARAELDRLLAMDPEDPEVRSLAGDVYAWTGAHSAAYKAYSQAADIFNRSNQPTQALGVHHKILELDPSLLDAATQSRIRLLGLLTTAEDAMGLEQYEKSVASYQEAIRQFPNHTITYQRLANLFVRLGRSAEAAEQYLTVARAFYSHGVHAKALPYYERVLELEPGQTEALENALTCLEAEGRQGEGARLFKAAIQRFLEKGENEAASAWFERLPPEARDGATPIGAALLLQNGQVQQAERMVGALDLTRPELIDWFKRMARASIERGDAGNADTYFKWAQGQGEDGAPAGIAVQVAPVPLPPTSIPAPPPAMAAPAPPPPTSIPAPPPAMAAPAPPPPTAISAPPPAMGVPAPPPPIPISAPPPPMAVPAPPPAMVAPAPPSAPMKEDERAVLVTMGEMCLAEDMYEEAKQVFERLLKVDPGQEHYWELLNRARKGLGLGPIHPQGPAPAGLGAPPPPMARSAPIPAPAALAPSPAPPEPSPVTVVTDFNPPELSAMGRRVNIPSRPQQIFAPPPIDEPGSQDFTPPAQAPAPPAPAAATPAPLVVAPMPVAATPEPVVEAPVAQVPETEAEEPATTKGTLAAMPIFNAMVEAMQNTAAPPPPVKPASPPSFVPAKLKIVTATHQVSLGEAPPFDDEPAAKPRVPSPDREPALAGAYNAKLVRTAYVVALGELPPATPSGVDLDDDIIG